jgi:hypothetical protein
MNSFKVSQPLHFTVYITVTSCASLPDRIPSPLQISSPSALPFKGPELRCSQGPATGPCPESGIILGLGYWGIAFLPAMATDCSFL